MLIRRSTGVELAERVGVPTALQVRALPAKPAHREVKKL